MAATDCFSEGDRLTLPTTGRGAMNEYRRAPEVDLGANGKRGPVVGEILAAAAANLHSLFSNLSSQIIRHRRRQPASSAQEFLDGEHLAIFHYHLDSTGVTDVLERVAANDY